MKSKQKQIALYLQNIVLGTSQAEYIARQKQPQTQHYQPTSKTFEITLDEIERLKKSKNFSIAQKIPSFIKSFSSNDLKQKNISAKNSSILRILTKWAESLQQIFEKPDIATMQRIYPFKTTQNQPINPYRHIKTNLYYKLIQSREQVKNALSYFQRENSIFQAEFLSDVSHEKMNSFVKRFSDTRQTASKMNAVLIKYMIKYINILIDKLIDAGKQFQVYFEEKTINLVSFRIGDLMRARLQCSQQGFINIFKNLYSLDQLDNHKFFKLVRIKNKLDSKDNNVLINFMFMGKTQCQLQLSIQNLGGKEKNYYSFSHFIYELTRGKFGALNQCAIIISQHDPQVASNKGIFYKPKRKSKPQKLIKSENQQNYVQKTLVDANDKKMFVCSDCRELIFNQNIDLLKTKGSQKEFLYVCTNCTLKDAKLKNLSNQQLINEEVTSKFLKKWVEKGVLIKMQKFDMQYLKQTIETDETILLRFDRLSTQLQLRRIWQYQNKSIYQLLYLTSQIPNMTTDQKIKQLVEYKDISKQFLNKVPADNFTYVVLNFQDKQFRDQLYPILKITHQCISNDKVFEYFHKELCRAQVLQQFNSKNQILNVFEDKMEIVQVERYFQSKMNEQLKQYISRVYTNYLQLQETPKFLDNWQHLKVLSLSDNQLTKINLSQKVELTELYLSKNQIKEVDLSSNQKLQIIYIGDNKLEGIKVDHLQNLKVLSLSSNSIRSIDVTKNVNLRELNMIDNKLQEINLQNNPQLNILYLATNQLTSLNLQNNLKLTKLNMYLKKISEYNLKNKPDLFWLRLSRNYLKQLDLSQNRKIMYLDLSNNKFTKLNLQNLALLQIIETIQLTNEAKVQDILLDGINKKCVFYFDVPINIITALLDKYSDLKINLLFSSYQIKGLISLF